MAFLVLLRAVEPRRRRREIAPGMARVALAIVLLNVVDAFGTLWNVALGAEELNPLMAHLLERGPVQFFAGKYLLAAGGVLGIVAYGRSRAARVALSWVLLPLYLLVGAYQLVLCGVI